MRPNVNRFITCLSLMSALIFLTAICQNVISSQTKPFTIGQILRAISITDDDKKALLKKIISDVKNRGVDFTLTKENEKLLRNEGATDELINVISEKSKPVTSSSTPLISNTSNTFKNSIGMEFIKLPKGSFMMGNADGESNVRSDQRVTVSQDFWIGKTEVTQGQWKTVMGNNPSFFKNCGDICPVEQVSWADVQNFIRKLNTRGEGTYRLPSEAEWEYARRAGLNTKFSCGNSEGELESCDWYLTNSNQKTHPVASKRPNAWGLYDMDGNVSEWTQDFFGNYKSGGITDPKGSNSDSAQVVRGGSWNSSAESSAYRNGVSSSYTYDTLGFRLVRQ